MSSIDTGLNVDVGPLDPTLGGHRDNVGDQQPQGHARRAGNGRHAMNDRRADDRLHKLQAPHKNKSHKKR